MRALTLGVDLNANSAIQDLFTRRYELGHRDALAGAHVERRLCQIDRCDELSERDRYINDVGVVAPRAQVAEPDGSRDTASFRVAANRSGSRRVRGRPTLGSSSCCASPPENPSHREMVGIARRLAEETSILRRDWVYFTVLADPGAQVFHDANYLLEKWSRLAECLAVQPEATGCQTALVFRKPGVG